MFQTEINTQLKHEEEFDGILRRICAQDKIITEQNKTLDEEQEKLEKLTQEKECKLIGLLKNTKKIQDKIEARVSVLVGKMNLIRKQGHPLTKSESVLYEKTHKIALARDKARLEQITEDIKHIKRKEQSNRSFSVLERYVPCNDNDLKETVKSLSKQTKGLCEMLESIKEIKAWIEIMNDP